MVTPIWLAPFNNVTVLLASAVPAMSIEGAVFCEGAVVTDGAHGRGLVIVYDQELRCAADMAGSMSLLP